MAADRPAFRVELLDARHPRDGFSCGVPALDRYLREQAMQDQKRQVAKVYVAIDVSEAIAGYYTLSAATVALAELPERVTRKLPKYPVVPAVLLGRLAVTVSAQRRGLGGALISHAALSVFEGPVASFAMLVRPTDAKVARFYGALGFARLDPDHLWAPLASLI